MSPIKLVVWSAALLFVGLVVSSQVRADSIAAPASNSPIERSIVVLEPDAAAPGAASGRGVVWNEAWPRVRAWEYIAAGVSYAGVFALELSGRPSEANWQGDFLFDFVLRDAIGTRDEGAVSAWTWAADIPFYVSLAYPALDALVVAGMAWGDWDVAWQMIAMGIEAYAVAVPLIFVTQFIVHRERPYSRFCDSDDPHADCGTSQETQSFPSGHVGLVATAAGLTCAHHTRLPLYGGGAGDIAACVTGIGAAVLTGVARMAVDSHYFSDVAVGLGIGALAGYAVPVLLHYGMRRSEAPAPGTRNGRGRGVRLAVVPTMSRDMPGVAAFGVFD